MRDLKSMLGGLGAKARTGPRRLRDLPFIAAVEDMHDVLGAAWSPAYDKAVAVASLAYFGISEADAWPSEPHPDEIKDDNGTPWRFSDSAFVAYDTVLTAWYDWQTTMRGMEEDIAAVGEIAFWSKLGVDVTDGHGAPLQCLPRFERQLYAALKGLLPGARFTPEGTGRRAPQSVDDWAAALARDAARFRSVR